MDLFLFHTDKYELYYNCSMFTTEEWNNFGVKRTNIGCFSIVLGVICLSLYLPCAKTMLKPKLWQLPCYKLMFLNAIIDIWGIINSCFLSGYLSIQGVVFCSYPTFQYIYSTLILSLWGAQCFTVMILAFNRCVEFWQKPALTSMFEGKKMAIWWSIPIIWFFVMFFYVAACPYTTIVNMWMIDPYFGIPGIDADKTPYENVIILNFTNGLTFIGLSSCYIFLIFSIWYKSRNLGSAAMSRVQRQVSIQACLICSIIYMCGGMYCFFEFFPQFAFPIFLTMDFFCWQWGFCGVIAIYMFMNKTLRHGVIEQYMGLFGYAAQSASSAGLSTVAGHTKVRPTAEQSKTEL